MNNIHLVLRNIRGNAFRSWVILLCVAGIAGFLIFTSFLIKGAGDSLNSVVKRLGADILVVPAGADTKIDSALLMGIPTDYWMSEDNILKVGEVPGVTAVAPQIYLSSLYEQSCCTLSQTFLVVFDPDSDFTVTPWLKNNLGRPLKKGEVIGGSTIFVPAVSRYISIYGYNTTLAGNLDQTGSGIDQTIFMTEDTAREIAAQSNINAVQPLIMPERKVSSILVKVKSGTDVHRIATQITQSVSGVQVIETTNLFAIYRQQLTGLLQGSVLIILIFWVLALFLIGIIFSLTVNERRREIAVLRAIGATRGYVLRLTLAESAALAFAGALSGAVVSGTLLYLFQDLIARTIKMPFLLPSLNIMLVFFLIGLLLALVTVVFASLVPAYRLSRQDLAITMRE